MSSGASLQLFPAPPTSAKAPKRKGSRRKSFRPKFSSSISQRTKSPTNTEEIVIHVSERPKAASQGPSSNDGPDSVPSRSQAASPALTNNQSVLSGSSTLVRSLSNASSAAPIQSMFPRYNPTVPLAKQDYRPTQSSPTHIPRDQISKQPYSPSQWSAQSPGSLGSPGKGQHSSTVSPAGISSFPQGVLGSPKPRYSSADELAELWEAANGQSTAEKGRTFALQMIRDGTIESSSNKFNPTENEAFTFGASKTQPFYDLQTLRTNSFDESFSECDIRRHDPRTGAVIPIMTIGLPASPDPPRDGLITTLYPKIAAMMALDRAQSVSASRSGPPSEEAKSRMISLATARETCRLAWDADSGLYFLLHPGLRKGAGQRFAVLIDGAAGFDVPGARGTIRIVEHESQQTLVALECGSNTLLIDTTATSSIDSLYIVDICVCTVLAVGIMEGRRLRKQVKTEKRISQPLTSPTIIGVESSAEGEIARAPVQGTEDALPKPAEGALSVLTVAFQFVVWALSMAFGAVAAVVVAMSACFGKKE